MKYLYDKVMKLTPNLKIFMDMVGEQDSYLPLLYDRLKHAKYNCLLSNKRNLKIQHGFSLSEQELSIRLVKKYDALVNHHNVILNKRISQLNKNFKSHYDSDLLIMKKVVILNKKYPTLSRKKQRKRIIKKPIILQQYQVIPCIKNQQRNIACQSFITNSKVGEKNYNLKEFYIDMTKNNILLNTNSHLVHVVESIDDFEKTIMKQKPLLILQDKIQIDTLCNTEEFNLVFPTNGHFQKSYFEKACIKSLALKQSILFVDIKILFSYMTKYVY